MNNKMKYELFFLILLLIPIQLWPVHDPTTIGAKTLGMGNIGVVGIGFNNLYNNQAALAYHHSITAGIDYDQGFFTDKSLSAQTLGIAIPTGFGTIGLNMRYFGHRLYNEQKIGLAYGKSLGKYLAIGVQLDYFRTYIGNDYGHAQAISFELALYSRLSEHLELGVHIFNPIGIQIGAQAKEAIPISFKLGLLYHVDEKLRLATEAEKILDEKTIYKFGLEYLIIEHFMARIGVASNPGIYTFGFGLKWNRLLLDIGTGYHQTLGLSPRVSLQFNFK